MKKTLALILAVLVAFSMFTVATFAAEEDENLVTVNFVDSDGKEFKTVKVAVGITLTSYVPENPVKDNTDTTKYTFKGWRSSVDGLLYAKNTIPNADFDVTYTAEYSEKDISGNQTLLQFFRSIFERINLIFEYFATIFNFSD
ncbi:MAG: hypothetical protein J6Q79_03715 [Clostridia bacterium]|nr:hypothetical protein [Clostridia bacterium]